MILIMLLFSMFFFSTGCRKSKQTSLTEKQQNTIYLADFMQNNQYSLHEDYQHALKNNPKLLRYNVERQGKTKSILHHPLDTISNAISFQDIPIPPHTQLQFSLGLFIGEYDSDGVLFKITLQHKQQQRTIFEHKFTDPNVWGNYTVDLSAYADQYVSIVLTTEPGRHMNYDWAIWGTPRLVTYVAYEAKEALTAKRHRGLISNYHEIALTHGELRVDRGWIAGAITTDVMLSDVQENTMIRNELYVLAKSSNLAEEVTVELIDATDNVLASTTYKISAKHPVISDEYPVPKNRSLPVKTRIILSSNPSMIFIKEPVQYLAPQAKREKPREHVILISLDTLRVDRLGCYGYARDVSPNIDAFARESFVFTNAYSNSNWTLPAHTSMFTSLYPSQHQITWKTWHDGKHLSYEGSYYSMTEAFKEARYLTLAFTGGGYVASYYGFNKGFDYHIENVKEFNPISLEILLKLIETHNTISQFIFFHTYEIHDFYQNKSLHHHYIPNHAVSNHDNTLLDRIYFMAENDEFGKVYFQNTHRSRLSQTDVQYLRDLYDGAIVYTDTLLGEFFDELKNMDMYDQSWIIVTSDHGEGLGESHNNNLTRSWYHGPRLYDNQIKIPLIIKPPKHRMQELSSSQRISRFVQTVDLAPTLLSIIGITAPDQFQGNNLLPLLTMSAPLPESDIFAESLKRYHFSIIRDNYKLLMTRYMPSPEDDISYRYELYNLSEDGNERINLLKTDEAAKYVPIYNELQQTLWEHNDELLNQKSQAPTPQKQTKPEIEDIDTEHLQRLKELGYL